MIRRRLLLLAVLTFLGTALFGEARASVIIDQFTTTQTVSTLFGTNPNTLTGLGTETISGTRTMSATASPTVTGATMQAASGQLSTSMLGTFQTGNTSSFGLSYGTFGPLDVTTGNQGLIFSDISVASSGSGTVSILVTANGTSAYTLTAPTGNTVQALILFSQFSNPGVFTALTSLDFTITFAQSTGGTAPTLTIDAPVFFGTVPEPSTFVMSACAGLCFLGYGVRRRYRTRAAA